MGEYCYYSYYGHQSGVSCHFEPLAEAMRTLTDLTSLELVNVPLDMSGAPFNECLVRVNALQHLSLVNASLSWRNLDDLSATLQQTTALQHLDLSNNHLFFATTPEEEASVQRGVGMFCDALRGLHNTITHIGLAYMKGSTTHGPALLATLGVLTCLQHVDISQNKVGTCFTDVSRHMLSREVAHLTKLRHLGVNDLDIFRRMGTEQQRQHDLGSMTGLRSMGLGSSSFWWGQVALPYAPALTALDLSRCSFLGAATFPSPAVCLCVLQCYPGLQEVDLSDTILHSAVLTALAKPGAWPALQSLALNRSLHSCLEPYTLPTTLQRLSVRANHATAGSVGFKRLGAGLSGLTSLQVLDMHNVCVGPDDVASLCPALSAMPQLRELLFDSNKAQDEGMRFLLRALAPLTQLEVLNVRDNCISAASALAGLSKLTSLRRLDIGRLDGTYKGLSKTLAPLRALRTLGLDCSAAAGIRKWLHCMVTITD